MKLSIIVPTFQTEDITPLLSALGQQSVQEFEVIVVENGNPQKFLSQQLKNSVISPVIKHIHELKPGLNRARNLGVRETDGSHIALIDDDCRPAENWVASIINAHQQCPTAGVIGGRVLLDYEQPPPLWLSSEFKRSLAELDYGEEQKKLGRWQHLVGANLSFSRDVFDEVGGFQESLGLKGGDEIIRANDEAEFIQKACLRGLPGAVYEGRAVVHHRIPASRIRFDYILRRRFGQGVSDIEHDLLHSGIHKALRAFYNQVFHSRWHMVELERDAETLSADNAIDLKWRGMLSRVVYLMGARERLLTRIPKYNVLEFQYKAEERAFHRGRKLAISWGCLDEHGSLMNLLERILYDPRTSFSPFIRVAMFAGIVQHELNIHVKAISKKRKKT